MPEEKTFIIHDQGTLITNVFPIPGGGRDIEKAEDLNSLVEAPLLLPLKVLFNKGIKSIQSSACQTGVWFHLMRDSMNEENISVALNMGFVPSRIVGSTTIDTLYIEYQLESTTTFKDVRDWATNIVEQFSNQRFTIN